MIDAAAAAAAPGAVAMGVCQLAIQAILDILHQALSYRPDGRSLLIQPVVVLTIATVPHVKPLGHHLQCKRPVRRVRPQHETCLLAGNLRRTPLAAKSTSSTERRTSLSGRHHSEP